LLVYILREPQPYLLLTFLLLQVELEALHIAQAVAVQVGFLAFLMKY
jgi:hypothetical protein